MTSLVSPSKEGRILIFKLTHKVKEEIIHNLSYAASIFLIPKPSKNITIKGSLLYSSDTEVEKYLIKY